MFYTMEYKKGFFITINSTRDGDRIRVIQENPRQFYDFKSLMSAKRFINKQLKETPK